MQIERSKTLRFTMKEEVCGRCWFEEFLKTYTPRGNCGAFFILRRRRKLDTSVYPQIQISICLCGFSFEKPNSHSHNKNNSYWIVNGVIENNNCRVPNQANKLTQNVHILPRKNLFGRD